MLFCRLLIFFPKLAFSKNSFRNTIRVWNSLDPDQARHFVGPDLDPNCLQRLSADNTSRQRGEVKYSICSKIFNNLLSCSLFSTYIHDYMCLVNRVLVRLASSTLISLKEVV